MTRSTLNRRIFPKHKKTSRAATRLSLERLEERCLLSTSATFVKQDTTTQGNWIGTYGSQGYDVIGNAASLPSYATVTPAGQSNYTWAASSTDPRALQDVGGAGRIAATWYSGSSFTVDVNLTDGQTHDLELYFVDWDSTTRAEQVQISDGSTGAVLDTEKVTSFNSGDYLNWAVSGNLLITITNTGASNAVLSGLFLDSASTTAATFVKQDTTTQGNWIGTYGSQGYDVIGNASSLPSYATVTPAGQSNYTWAASSTDPRALQDAGGTGRIAATWYSGSSFTVDVNLTDGQTHDLELYFLDWDSTTRAEQVQISNASTGAVLNTENVTSFNSGEYLNWAVSGNLLITITNMGGANAVLSGLFLDPPTTTTAPTVTAESPASGATNVAVSSSVTATFNEAVQASPMSFALTPNGGSPVAATVTYNSSNYTVTLSPSSALAFSTVYTATVSGAEDSAGDPMPSPFSWSFTTIADPPSTPPAVSSETPSSGASNVAVSSTATVTFNEAVQASTIGFTLTPHGGSPVAATFTYNSSNFTVTLTPGAALAYSTTYTATVSGAEDSAGDPMPSPFSWSFTTMADPPSTLPAVSTETPASGATSIGVSTAVTATFNEAVQASTINFTLTNSSGIPVSATVSYNSSTDTTTLTPSSPLSASTTYTASVSGAQDLAGDSMASFSWSFTTASSSSTSAAFIEQNEVTQGNWIGTYGAQGYDVIGNATSLPSYASITPTGESSWTWAASTADPRALQDAGGAGRIAATWLSNTSFTVDVNLTDGQTHDLELYFVDWDSTTRAEQVQISNASTGAVLSTESVTSFNSGDYLNWAVSGNLLITITNTGSPNAVLSGLFLDPPQTVGTRPAVIQESPVSGATGASNVPTITATFNEPVQPSTISFTLANSSGTTIPATLSYNSSNNVAALTPNAILPYSTTYTATLSGAQNASGVSMAGSVSWSFTTAAAPGFAPSASTGEYIITDEYTIPNYAYSPTVYSVASGSWSSGSTWSTGQVPGAGALVSIAPGTAVTYDANSTTVLGAITVKGGGTLQFSTSVSTEVIAGEYLVLPGGTLDVGTQANPIPANITALIETANQAINTTFDPSQYGDSLIGLGNVTIYGAAKTPFGQLAVEPHAGDTTLTFSSPVSGWQSGDELYLPDTRQLTGSGGSNPGGSAYVPEYEFLTIASISSNGLVVTLTSPLQFNHLGAYGINGNLMFLAQVADMTRNVVICSQNGGGTRGVVMFLDRANVNINSADFLALGRTTNATINDTIYNSDGTVASTGTNQQDRSPVVFLNLWGPISAQANGYQYTFNDNVVNCPMMPQDHIWGVEVNNSSYGLIEGNIVDNWYGAGIALVNGTEVYNMIEGNFVMQTTGTGLKDQTGLDGLGYWSLDPDNSWVNNVATDINSLVVNGFSYGFDINASFLFYQTVPAYQGADPTQLGQAVLVNMNAIPLLEFSGDEIYGASTAGLGLWWLGTEFDTPVGNAGTLEDYQFWNLSNWGYFSYQTNDLILDNVVGIGDPSVLSNPYVDNFGLEFTDYMNRGAIVENADLQNLGVGIATPSNTDIAGSTGDMTGYFTIENSYLANVMNIYESPTGSTNGDDLAPVQAVVDNVIFAQPNVNRTFYNIYEADENPNEYGFLQVALVYNYNGIAGDNFQVYPTYVTTYGTTTMPLIYGYIAGIDTPLVIVGGPTTDGSPAIGSDASTAMPDTTQATTAAVVDPDSTQQETPATTVVTTTQTPSTISTGRSTSVGQAVDAALTQLDNDD